MKNLKKIACLLAVFTFILSGNLVIAQAAQETSENNQIVSDGSAAKTDAVENDHEHVWETEYTILEQATTTQNGSRCICCSECGEIKEGSKTIIYAAKNISLSKTSYVYNEKVQRPSVTVKNSEGAIIDESNYMVSYSGGGKNMGIYKVKIAFQNEYSGSKTLSYKIIPKQIANLKMSSRTYNKIKLTWTKQAGVTGYQVYKYNSSKKAWKLYKTIEGSGNNSCTVIDLTSLKKYKFKVRAYKVASDKNLYGAYSSAYSCTTLPKTPEWDSVRGAKSGYSKTLCLSWKKVSGVTGYQIMYTTDKDMKKNVKYTSTTNLSKKITGLKSKTTYYVKVRAYKTINDKKLYGAWSVKRYAKTK